MKQEQIDRINELTRISRERELTKAEQEERITLRAQYIVEMRGSLQAHLDNIKVETPDGVRRRLKQHMDKEPS